MMIYLQIPKIFWIHGGTTCVRQHMGLIRFDRQKCTELSH